MDRPSPDTVAYVSVGSNIQAQDNVSKALRLVLESVTVTGISTFYQTTPVGPPNQPSFVNGVWQIQTKLSPQQLTTRVLRPVEAELGRLRSSDRFAPRPIDLDLILYNDLVCQEENMVLPHPDIERPFVWAPILELLNAMPVEPRLARNMKNLLPLQQNLSNWGVPLGRLTQTLRKMIQS